MALLDFSEEEFNRKALEFFNISEALSDNWKLNEKSEKIYLTKRKTITTIKTERPPAIETADYDADPSVSTHNSNEDLISVEYHVLFHPSYQVPALFFNAHSDGALISLDDISKVFVDDFKLKTSREEMQNIITQAEHPILFQPFFLVHPCKVNEILSQFPESKNFILTFLTLFGPSVHLKMNPEYEKFLA